MAEFATIGVYGFDGPGFIRTLHGADVGLILDVRQRRGVRGSEYAWANAKRLQAALAEAGIGYSHLPELAPTAEMRPGANEGDAPPGEGKNARGGRAPREGPPPTEG